MGVLDAAACVSPDSDQKLTKKEHRCGDGRLPAAARSEGLTSLSERSKKNAKSSRQLRKKDPSLPGLKA